MGEIPLAYEGWEKSAGAASAARLAEAALVPSPEHARERGPV